MSRSTHPAAWAARLTMAIAVCLALVVIAPAPAPAAGLDETCLLALTKIDEDFNVLFPDQAATYWSVPYVGAPGARLRITGRYPYARYFSYNAYDVALRPVDAVADVEIAPETAGVTNPFLIGADRTIAGADRNYTLFVDFGPKPANPADRKPNTLYTGTGQTGAPNLVGLVTLRVYVPDAGHDETGGVGLPTVTLEPATSTDPRPADSPCIGRSKPVLLHSLNQALANSNGSGLPETFKAPGNDPPRWRKFQNLVVAFADSATGNAYLQGLHDKVVDPARPTLVQIGGQGGFASNVHNAYVAATINRAYGKVLLTRFRAPTFPDTRPGTPTMPGGQLRYFSMCENELLTQRFYACRTDDQTTVDDDGYVNYVVSTPSQRPANATAACGFTWLPWGFTAGGVLIYRNMLPPRQSPAFPQAIQFAQAPDEAATMGDYFPVSKYFADKAAFESATAATDQC